MQNMQKKIKNQKTLFKGLKFEADANYFLKQFDKMQKEIGTEAAKKQAKKELKNICPVNFRMMILETINNL